MIIGEFSALLVRLTLAVVTSSLPGQIGRIIPPPVPVVTAAHVQVLRRTVAAVKQLQREIISDSSEIKIRFSVWNSASENRQGIEDIETLRARGGEFQQLVRDSQENESQARDAYKAAIMEYFISLLRYEQSQGIAPAEFKLRTNGQTLVISKDAQSLNCAIPFCTITRGNTPNLITVQLDADKPMTIEISAPDHGQVKVLFDGHFHTFPAVDVMPKVIPEITDRSPPKSPRPL